MKQMDNQRRNVQTSTTIGHAQLQPFPFYFKTGKNAPLPPVLQRQNKVPASAHFSLTSHTEHDRKPLNGSLYNEIHSKAPEHWTTHFLSELAQRLRDRPTVRVVSNPISEMQDRYRGQLAAREPPAEHFSMMQALYRQLETAQTAFVQEPVRSTTTTDFKHFNRQKLHCLVWNTHKKEKHLYGLTGDQGYRFTLVIYESDQCERHIPIANRLFNM
ncbi:uncharacterized protein LOC107729427 [Sinocyclocheilus rhinocerous]|uniref:uncharacterized protein LOC107729427 n=1 Tax=Sinocyclocheilus rhinocerous TaxID=307959 RepID=UPI0007BA3527|nr:PREDICTED: uncharacterized protein LOC107729427 [Sinocyclocheilus rhinocerous]